MQLEGVDLESFIRESKGYLEYISKIPSDILRSIVRICSIQDIDDLLEIGDILSRIRDDIWSRPKCETFNFLVKYFDVKNRDEFQEVFWQEDLDIETMLVSEAGILEYVFDTCAVNEVRVLSRIFHKDSIGSYFQTRNHFDTLRRLFELCDVDD